MGRQLLHREGLGWKGARNQGPRVRSCWPNH